jgi:acetyltransferase-like isoleucine patch superfamily enzyme
MDRRYRNLQIAKSSGIGPDANIVSNGDRGLIRIGSHSYIQGELRSMFSQGSIVIGDFCFIGKNSYIWSGDKVVMGDYVLVSHGVTIMDNSTHPLDPERREAHIEALHLNIKYEGNDIACKPVIIGDRVWIGCNSVILPGVIIGSDAIIGAGSVVTKNVPTGATVGGNPAASLKAERR